jgi:thiosulfate/3-mercaptopyruvate sulfurtransferase
MPRFPTPLISVAALAALLGEATADLDPAAVPSLLDVRWSLGGPPGRVEYEAGHVPGAAFVDLDTDLAGPPGPGGRHPLPAAGAFGASMRAAGVSRSRPVVVYDAAASTSAARAWWLLRHAGHPSVSVLDGGLAAWTQDGHPVQRTIPVVAIGDFTARPGAMPVLDATSAARLARQGVLLDARAGERFRGEHEPIDSVAGHIPGARSRPTTDNVDPSGRFLDRATLARAFEEFGATSGAEIGAYCGSGVTAAHEILALEIAGYRAALYPGSWSEWITDPQRPVATGPQ